MSYQRLRIDLVDSDYSDYGGVVDNHAIEVAATGAEAVIALRITSETTGTSLDFSNLAAATHLLVENLDTTNYVTVVYRTSGGAAVDQTVELTAGEVLHMPDFDPATAVTATADTADCKIRVSVW